MITRYIGVTVTTKEGVLRKPCDNFVTIWSRLSFKRFREGFTFGKHDAMVESASLSMPPQSKPPRSSQWPKLPVNTTRIQDRVIEE
jgi:hypothetical protein